MSSRRPPYTRPKNPRPIRLTRRDKQILETIHAFDGMMSRKQIDRLFFAGKGRTQPRQRMQALFDHGYVNMPDAEEIHRVPLGEVIYWLDKKGAKLVAGLRGNVPSGFSWRKKPRWSLLEHDLAVNDVRIAVREACQRSPLLTLEQWITDNAFRADPDTVKTRKNKMKNRQVIPDAFFSIHQESGARPGEAKQFSFLLEVDMATESNPRFVREKVRAGIAYLGGKMYRKRFGVSYGRYLVITSGERRLAHLKRATEKAGGKGLFYFTTLDSLTNADVLRGHIWQLAGNESRSAIIPDAPKPRGEE